jgi:hypothetical protein
MVRTQVYLTEAQHDGLATLAKATGKKQSELIREAVDHVIEKSSRERRMAILKRAAGMWKDRDDIPELFEQLRAEWDRRIEP